ncbi:D-cysteine desulfhydrase family protein [Dactylosporangium sp. NPDC050688]|uniref:D-cysteine desulfhydrase family protein n=1 Tax=Dactylosporangium sp. NPDC050688 TaxID=3157217 RepID=UPI0033E143FD
MSDTVRLLRERIDGLPRVRLAHLPTPLDACARVSAQLGPTIWVKRDDCTGLAFGGNKVRQHEFVLADAIAQGADCVIQGSASQSNHSRQLAAAGAKLGLDVFLLPKLDAMSDPVQGNYLVSNLLGASIEPIGMQESTKLRKEELAAKLLAQGRRPYVVGMGATRSLVLATVAYVAALLEIVDALGPDNPPDWIFTTSQGSTQAGLQLGCEALGLSTKIVGINPLDARHEAYQQPEEIAGFARGAAQLLGVTTAITAADIVNSTDYVGESYGVPSEAGIAAMRTLAAAEGILLDPIYSGKGFAGLIDFCRRGVVEPGDRVVFLHTGGLPALFSYAADLVPAR